MFPASGNGSPQTPAQQLQRGSALIISLVMLLLMTVIGVTAVQTTTMQERMAGNTRDRQLAFQAAEAALREAEDYLSDGTVVPGPFNNSNGLFQPEGEGEERRWRTVNWDGGDVVTVNYPDEQVSRPPAYIIEQLAVASRTGSSLAADEVGTQRSYRITAMGWGGSEEAVVVLQTGFLRERR